MAFLMGLNESFAQTRGQILLMDPIPSIDSFFFPNSSRRTTKVVGARSENPASFAIQAAENISIDPKSKGAKKEKPMCAHCGVVGHVKEKCFKFHGYPPNYKKLGKGSFLHSSQCF